MLRFSNLQILKSPNPSSVHLRWPIWALINPKSPMKQFFKMFFASLLAMVIAGVILFVVAIGMIVSAVSSMKTAKTTTSKNATQGILLIETDKRLHEQGARNSLAAFSNDVSYSVGLYDAIRALHEAKTDNNIKAVFLKLEGGANAWATLQQMREALVDFKTSGKKIYAYGEGLSQKDYYLASTADLLYLNPSGMMELKGLSSNITFFKGALDKFGVQPEIFYAGKFKSATEPFRAEQISEPNRVQISAMQQDIWSEFLQAAAEKSKRDTASLNQIAATRGVFFASDAQAEHLIDAAKYWDEMEDQMRRVVDKKTDEKLPYITISEYADQLDEKNDGDRIALLFAEGEIVDGVGGDYQIGSESLVNSIRQIRRNDKIKAVVLRVNSPGGSALASEVILRELRLLKAKKKLVVSMGDLAASGGYYISCDADSIFAMPNTITGSIGVFGMMFNISGGMKDKLGVTFDGVKNAPLADFPTATRPLNALESARMQATIDTIYAQFKGRVVAGRKLDATLVDSVAQGRVWTGSDALAIGLVDKLGGLDRAIQSAAALAKIKDYRVVTYPEPVDQFKAMLRRLQGSPFAATAVREGIRQELQEASAIYQQLEWMKRTNGKAQARMPFVPEFE
jgi:protease-4